MCGIVGFNWCDKDSVKESIESLEHRGPDNQGIYVDEGVSLGHARLSIIDLSERGNQPMVYGDYVIVYNGEVYNFREIREELLGLGHHFESETDTEVVLHAYSQWLEKCLEKFNGMFAFCIYDKKKREFFLARDRLGIKPLFYQLKGGKFTFSSETSTFSSNEGINLNALGNYLTFRFIPNRETLINGVYRLPAGHYLRFSGGEITIKRYWAVSFGVNKNSIESNSKKICSLLEDSVERRLVSDVPVGVFLSGGLDSSAITSIMSRVATEPVNSFTVNFEGENTSDVDFARIVSEEYNTVHHEINVDVDAVKILPEVVRFLGEPAGDAATIPTYLMARETKKHVKVVLSGEGSDELFAGYNKYKLLYYSRYLPSFPRVFKTGFMARINSLFDGDQESKYRNVVSVFNSNERSGLLMFDHTNTFSLKPYFNTGDYLNNLLSLDLQTWLPNDLFLKNDRMTMAHSIEARVPFMDRDLIEFCLSIPKNQKLRFLRDKFVYRKAIRDILPKKVCDRKKQGFTIPLSRWLRNGLADYARSLASEVETGFLDKKYVEKILSGAGDNIFLRRQFWTLLFLFEWVKQNQHNQ